MIFKNLRYDVPASIVVFLVALPLCLGVALAAGVPLLSGIVGGVVGGIVVGALSRSHTSVSGPAAALIVIMLKALEDLPSFEAFLLAVCLSGLIQIVFSLCRGGIFGEFIPSTVIKGMLTAIGLILILKQIPHAIGYDRDFVGNSSFWQPDHENTFSAIWISLQHDTMPGAIVISLFSLIFMACWEKMQTKFKNGLLYLPSPLIVVVLSILANEVFKARFPLLAIGPEHLVTVPISRSIGDLWRQLCVPDFSLIWNPTVWLTALTLALVTSIETLLSIEAVDKLDPFKRVTPTNWELLAQGVGNMTSGLLGGLPITSVIVRSSANVSAGGRTKMSTILHGIFLFLSVLLIPKALNKIPLSALAAILIAIGYKLAKPQIFIKKYNLGYAQFIPFVTTVVAIMFTDLLKGIAIGVLVGVIFVLRQNFRSALLYVKDGQNCLVRLKKDFFFLHKCELRRVLSQIPRNSKLLLDVSRASFIDPDNIEIIHNFMTNAQYRNIEVTLKTNPESRIEISL